MTLDLSYECSFDAPIERVWQALTDPDALASWLMDNDFQPFVGHRFTLRGTAMPGWRGWTECEVLEIESPWRMVWAWRAGEMDFETSLTFVLTPEGDGTRLALTHVGAEDPVIAGLLASGWPGKLEALVATLGTPPTTAL